MARAALAAGADGLLIEVHPEPERALSDGPQALLPEDFARLMRDIRGWLPMLGRTIAAEQACPGAAAEVRTR